VVEIGGTVGVHENTGIGAGRERAPACPSPKVSALQEIATTEWRDLSARSLEPNAYYSQAWASAVDASARDRSDMQVVAVRRHPDRLIGLLPVVTAWRAWKIPLPVLVSADAYGPLGTPHLDRNEALEAAKLIMTHAAAHGAQALVLRDIPLDGSVAKAFTQIVGFEGRKPTILHAHERACLDTTGDADTILREALGPKKLKELRRQRNRLGDHGDVVFSVAKSPEAVSAALDTFLALEASGWKGERGTALVQHSGDEAFIRRATAEMAARGECEIITLHAGETPVAAGIVLRHGNRAFWFKLGVDEQFAKLSPGVQLALDLTKHLCDDPAIACVDSSTNAGPHAMIDPIWRGRLVIGDLVVPLKRYSPVVPALVAAIKARARARSLARQTINQLRHLKEKRQ
jgi:CelD/BcsL family acetyltransferase involved in cellulose biosynthesis